MSPEVGTAATVMGREFNVECEVVEVGFIRQEPMIRVIPIQSKGGTRTFTKRKTGQWIERGENTRHGSRLIVGDGPS